MKMPIKKDGNGQRWVEMDLLVPGTPEQVWAAMATGPGNTAWFIPSEITPEVGGTIRFNFGQGVSTSGEVTTWQPPYRFGYVERDWEPGAPPVATEITITGRAGNQCVVRMVHSLFASSDDWDDQLEGFEKGWPGYFALLRTYLRHFAGMPAASFMSMTACPGDALSAWQQLGQQFDLAGASVDERRTPAGLPEAWSGIVEHVYQDAEQRYILLRLDAPSPGMVLVGTHQSGADLGEVESHIGKRAGTNITLCRYYYGEEATTHAAESEARWRVWLQQAFAPTTA
jgi:uncharacterized protein YndB with AHSA1/START domain